MNPNILYPKEFIRLLINLCHHRVHNAIFKESYFVKFKYSIDKLLSILLLNFWWTFKTRSCLIPVKFLLNSTNNFISFNGRFYSVGRRLNSNPCCHILLLIKIQRSYFMLLYYVSHKIADCNSMPLYLSHSWRIFTNTFNLIYV